MLIRTPLVVLAGALCAVVALAAADEPSDPVPSGGAFTVRKSDRSAYSEPGSVLNAKQLQKFMLGRLHFNVRWVVISSLEGDWGLGPTFIADSCSACHVRAGRGSPPRSADEQLLSMLVRISIPGEDEHGGPKPHPNYGDQFQNRALQGQSIDLAYSGEPVPQEADLFLDWEPVTVTFADGERIELRRPKLRVEHLNFGALGEDTLLSLRIAPPIFGLGLLEAVPESAVLALAERQKAEGFHGRPNYVWDAVDKRTTLGRFGWKANQPSLKQQIAAAAIGDMGVNSHLYYAQNCPPVQVVCAKQLPANDPELVDGDWEDLELWLQGLAVPAQRNAKDPQFARGEALFVQARCAVCHVPELRTGDSFPPLPQLARQTFRPYTDLLLHDMGEGLADGRPDFRAGGRDWRTAPLWGLGLSQTVTGSSALLHDGRARNAAEAILWHGGEAALSRDAFLSMSRSEREALIRFLESI
jgi:CxxC motif-containing protein (DUF1111 family)